MKHLKLVLVVTCSLVVLLTQAVAAQDPPSGDPAGGPGGQFDLPPNDLAVRVAAERFDEALLAAEAEATGRSRPGAILVTPPFRCNAILGVQTSAERLAAAYRDPWERDLAPVRSQYADLLAMATDHGVAGIALAFAGRMDRLEQAYAVGPSDQVREAIEFFDQDHHWHPAYPIMELVVPLMTVPGQGEDGEAGVDPRNLEALRTWGQHIAGDLVSQVLSDRKYSLIGPIVRLGQAGGRRRRHDPGDRRRARRRPAVQRQDRPEPGVGRPWLPYQGESDARGIRPSPRVQLAGARITPDRDLRGRRHHHRARRRDRERARHEVLDGDAHRADHGHAGAGPVRDDHGRRQSRGATTKRSP